MSPTLPPPPPVPPHQPMPPAQQRPASGRARILPTRQPEEVQVAPARKLPRTSQRASVGISSSPIKRSPPVSRLPRDGTAEPPSQAPAGSGLDSRPTTSDIRARDQGRKRLNSDANGTLPDPSAWAEAGAEERFGVETPMPGRERQYAAFKSLNARGGYGGMGASASVSPPIDADRMNRSPGLKRNFYDVSTADFKRPYGSAAGTNPSPSESVSGEDGGDGAGTSKADPAKEPQLDPVQPNESGAERTYETAQDQSIAGSAARQRWDSGMQNPGASYGYMSSYMPGPRTAGRSGSYNNRPEATPTPNGFGEAWAPMGFVGRGQQHEVSMMPRGIDDDMDGMYTPYGWLPDPYGPVPPRPDEMPPYAMYRDEPVDGAAMMDGMGMPSGMGMPGGMGVSNGMGMPGGMGMPNIMGMPNGMGPPNDMDMPNGVGAAYRWPSDGYGPERSMPGRMPAYGAYQNQRRQDASARGPYRPDGSYDPGMHPPWMPNGYGMNAPTGVGSQQSSTSPNQQGMGGTKAEGREVYPSSPPPTDRSGSSPGLEQNSSDVSTTPRSTDGGKASRPTPGGEYSSPENPAKPDLTEGYDDGMSPPYGWTSDGYGPERSMPGRMPAYGAYQNQRQQDASARGPYRPDGSYDPGMHPPWMPNGYGMNAPTGVGSQQSSTSPNQQGMGGTKAEGREVYPPHTDRGGRSPELERDFDWRPSAELQPPFGMAGGNFGFAAPSTVQKPRPGAGRASSGAKRPSRSSAARKASTWPRHSDGFGGEYQPAGFDASSPILQREMEYRAVELRVASVRSGARGSKGAGANSSNSDATGETSAVNAQPGEAQHDSQSHLATSGSGARATEASKEPRINADEAASVLKVSAADDDSELSRQSSPISIESATGQENDGRRRRRRRRRRR